MTEPVTAGADRFAPSRAEVKTITIDMPYHVNHVHVYLAECESGLVLFDTGPPLADAKRCLRENIDFARLRYVFITHGHIDHCGLAGFLQKETNAQIVLSRGSAAQLSGGKTSIDKLTGVLKNLGFPNASALLLAETVSQINKLAPLPPRYLVAEESTELLDSLGVDTLACPWHSQGDLVYLLDGHAFLGDVAIGGTFPVPLLNADYVNTQSIRFDSYAAFCTSMENLKQIQGKTLLPSHNKPLVDLDGWICFTVNKLLGRALKLRPLYTQHDNVYQTVRQFFGSPEEDPLKIYLKTSEIAFMYDFLNQPKKLQEVLLRHDLFHLVERQFASLFPLSQSPDNRS